MIQAEFTRGGKPLFVGTTYAGTIGLSTGMSLRSKPTDAPWAFSINARKSFGGLADAVAAARAGGSVFPVLPRLVMEAAATNATLARTMLSAEPLILPGYLIFAGSTRSDGAVITRNASGAEVWNLDPPLGGGGGGGGGDGDGWFRVETNYDHWKSVPSSDDRRAPADAAMRSLDAQPTFEGLWKVLNTHPVYNVNTIHTDLAFPADGEYRSFARVYPS